MSYLNEDMYKTSAKHSHPFFEDTAFKANSAPIKSVSLSQLGLTLADSTDQKATLLDETGFRFHTKEMNSNSDSMSKPIDYEKHHPSKYIHNGNVYQRALSIHNRQIDDRMKMNAKQLASGNKFVVEADELKAGYINMKPIQIPTGPKIEVQNNSMGIAESIKINGDDIEKTEFLKDGTFQVTFKQRS